MSIEMTGIDYQSAEIDIRMIFSFTKKSTVELLEYMKQEPGIEGCVLLSTCNRMELWVSTSAEWKGGLYEKLCWIRKVPAEVYRKYFTSRSEKDAVRHLFSLTSGLKSQILGEDQILTQVGEALAFSRQHYAADHVLETLFRQAVTVAKKIKTSAPLSHADQSVVHTMIRDLKRAGMLFTGKKCLVIGNGVMGKLAASLLQQEGADVTMTVRQYRSGVVDIPKGCRRIDYGRRMELFAECDYVISATVSPNYTLTEEAVIKALYVFREEHELQAACSDVSMESAEVFNDDGLSVQNRAHEENRIVLMDLAVPRDIDPNVKNLPGIILYDIDSFREEAHGEEQKEAIRKADQLVDKQMEEFFGWYECLDVMPLIQKLKQEMAQDVTPRLSKKLKALPLEEASKLQLEDDIETAACSAANRMLFALRDGLDPHTFRACLKCLDELY